MVTKLVLEIHALCNKNEISYMLSSHVKCNIVTLLTLDLPKTNKYYTLVLWQTYKTKTMFIQMIQRA